MKLIQFIVSQTSINRRMAAQMIKEGAVKVGSNIIEDMNYEFKPGNEKVVIDRKAIRYKKNFYYYKFNKPSNVICSFDDPRNRRTIKAFMAGVPEQIFAVGRLDRNTKGLLLFTNDGNFSNRVQHPSYSISKEYRVTLDKPITKRHFQRLTNGLILEDGPVSYSKAILMDDNMLEVTLSEGRNRIVRRTFEFFGYKVKGLKRLAIGPVKLGVLKEGCFKELTKLEQKQLKVDA